MVVFMVATMIIAAAAAAPNLLTQGRREKEDGNGLARAAVRARDRPVLQEIRKVSDQG